VKRNISFVAAIIIILLIFMLSNMIVRAALDRWRFDFTDEKVYSLSEGTKNILQDIKGHITLKFYYSKKEAVGIPFLKNYADRVRDLLNEYKLAGDGHIVIEFYEHFSNQGFFDSLVR